MFPRRPAAHEIAVGNEYTRRALVGAEHSDRLPALHQQRLIVAEVGELAHDSVGASPAARCLSGAAVHHEILWSLRYIGIQVVHEHPQRGFLLPTLARDL